MICIYYSIAHPNTQHGETEIDETEQLENQYVEYATIENYIGTTFDDSKLLGRDYNGSVTAAIRNASLKQGYKTYGLALNGLTSYMRYPIGILDDVSEFSISISYYWNGVKSGTGTQKLFGIWMNLLVQLLNMQQSKTISERHLMIQNC